MKRTLLALALSLFVAAGMLVAQELAGRIQGSVADATGAVIPGANVTATHVATNTIYRGTTSRVGQFVIPSVRLGRYTIAVEASGFGRGVVTDVLVQVGRTASVNITLEVGALEVETVVTADTAQEIINTVNAELGAVVDERRVLELPLDGRNATHLVLMQAGVYFERSATGQGNKLFVHGQRHRSLNITLDGLDTQDNFNRASSIMIDQPLIALAAENIQEFKLATGNTSAEYSRGGAQISAVTRSGSNEWHGSLFWFHRNDAFSANAFFNNSSGIETPKLLRNQFGGRIGGPIVKDKTFFFFGYDQLRLRQGLPVNRTVWSEEARRGIVRFLNTLDDDPFFRAADCLAIFGRTDCPARTTPENVAAWPQLIWEMDLLDCSGTTDSSSADCFDDRFDVVDPIVAFDPAFGVDRLTLDPFILANIIGNMPLPNNTDLGDGLNLMGFRFNSRSNTTQHLPSFRLDHVFSPKHSFYTTFNYTDRLIVGDFVNGRPVIWPTLGPLGLRTTLSKAFSAGLTSTFTPTIVNELRAGVTLGENAFPRQQPFDTPFSLDIDDISDPYSPGGTGGTGRDNETWHLRDTVSWVRGKHQFKFGGEWRHRYVKNVSHLETEFFGEIDFNDSDFDPGWSTGNLESFAVPVDPSTPATSLNTDSADVNNIEELNNALIGAIGDVEMRFNFASLDDPTYVVGVPETRRWENEEFDLFFNDTWQIRPGLTLNLGLRWEYATVPDENNGLIFIPEGGEDAVFGVSGPDGFFNPGVFAGHGCDSSIFPFDLAALLASPDPTLATRANALDMINGCATRSIFGGASNGVPIFDDDYNNFGPVVSLAWDPWGDGKTSIRAGYRISYFQDAFGMIEDHLDDNEGLRFETDCEPSDSSKPCQNVDPNDNLAALLRNLTGPPIPPIPTFTEPFGVSFLNSNTQDIRTYIKDLGTPYYQEWNLSVSREFWGNTAIEVRYVGNRGLKLRRTADFNEININALDPGSGQTFLEAYQLAQANLACNRSVLVGDAGNDYSSTTAGTAAGCFTANPLMDALIAGDSGRLDSRDDLIEALDDNEPGDFIWHLTIEETSRVAGSGSRIRGGSFWGQVLAGRFPANFFTANPFIASSRRMVNDGFSTYHALEIEVRRRLSQGLMFEANYTFGKALTDFDGDQNTLINDVRPSSVRNPRYTTGQFMPRHQFNANWIYELPFGPDKAFAPGSTVARKLLGGWQFGGILRLRSGRPFSIESNRGTFHRNGISDANTVNLSQPLSNDDLRNLTGQQNIAGGVFWLDPCMSVEISGTCSNPDAIASLFQLPTPGALGTLSQTPFYGPSRFILDLSLMKRTQLTETVNVEFRWEVFNATNTTNFNLPVSDIFSREFGQILNTITEARRMQFALKINF